jgi:hypothetical protein
MQAGTPADARCSAIHVSGHHGPVDRRATSRSAGLSCSLNDSLRFAGAQTRGEARPSWYERQTFIPHCSGTGKRAQCAGPRPALFPAAYTRAGLLRRFAPRRRSGHGLFRFHLVRIRQTGTIGGRCFGTRLGRGHSDVGPAVPAARPLQQPDL